MHDLKEKIGKEFQPEYKKFIDTMMEATKWAREHADALKMVAEAVVVLGGALAVAAIGAKIAAIAAATQGLVLALAANPFAVIALGAAAAGVAVYSMWQRLQDANDALGEQIKLERTWKAIHEGKTPEQMKAMGMDEKDVRKALSGGREPLPGRGNGEWNGEQPQLARFSCSGGTCQKSVN